MVSLPGSYPLDDSAPATPEEPISHRHQSHQIRNKLPKPNDPRSHQQSDSGVGSFGMHDADLSKAHEPAGNEYLDATGGDYYTYEPIQPSSAVESQNIHHTAPQGILHDTQHESGPRETQSSEQPRGVQAGKPSSSKSDEGSSRHSDKVESAPYWGDLPKGQRGGIYNTVTGHGSPKDDHDQHHHIPEKSPARERSHIPGPVGAAADKTTARVYNTVTGHGSRESESNRHTTSPSRAASGAATVSSTEAVHDAPLVGIPEEKSSKTGLSSTARPSSDLGMGFLPEAAVQDDVKLLARHEERLRSHGDSKTGPSAAWATEMSGPKATGPSHSTSGPKADTMHQRAFPLGPSNMLGGEDTIRSKSAQRHDANLGAAEAPKDQKAISNPEADSNLSTGDHHGRDAMFAGAGVAGTGIAASELADRHESSKSSPRSISEDRHGRKRLSKVDRKPKDMSSTSGSDYSNHKDKHSPEGRGRTSREEEAPKTEKMSHKILGMFGLNKDDKPSQDAPVAEPVKERSRSRHSPLGRHKEEKDMPGASTTEPQNDKSPAKREKSPRHSHDRKKEATVGAAAGAGVVGLMARKKDAEKSKHYQEPTEASRHHEHTKQVKDIKQTSFRPDQRQVFQGVTQPTTKTAGPMGSTAQGPIGPGQQPPAPAGKPGNDNTAPNFSHPHPTDRSKVAPVAAGLGAAAVGLGSYQAAHKHEDSTHSQPTSSGTSAPHAFENPRAPPHTNTESHSQTTGAGSSLASAPTTQAQHAVVTNKPGEYNTLSSGTASGVATDSLPHQRSAIQDHGKEISTKNYDTLASGTASGINFHHAPQGPITQKPGDYNSLPSGTASGVKTHNELEGPAAQSTQKERDSRTLHSGRASVGAATSIGTEGYGNKEKESARRSSTGNYNKLASGTPSGVVVEPRRSRASEDHSHRSGDYKHFPTDSSGNQTHRSRGSGSEASSANTQQSYQLPPPPIPRSAGEQGPHESEISQPQRHSSGPGFVSVPITSRPPRHDRHHEQQPKLENTATTDTADRVRHMSPEVMPSAYTTSTPRTGNLTSHRAPYGDSSTADQVRHMSPEVMPSAYTTSAPRSSHLTDSTDLAASAAGGQGPTAHSHSTDVDPALAAATGAWASSGGPTVVGGSGWPANAMSRGPGGKTVLHTCEHCGRENDITAYVASHQAI